MMEPPDKPSKTAGMGEAGKPGATGSDRRRCPTCGKPAEVRWRPFCSKRCADVDLGRWLSDAYRIPTEDEPAADDDTGDPPNGVTDASER
jgi:endogenous inhibitor of DNA gyrase (YacG/DUF329 family)